MNKKTAFKGMTLFEIVVSIAIYGVIALLLVEIMGTVNSTMRATTTLNERLSYEQKFADNRMTVADSRGEVKTGADLKTLKITFGKDEASTKSLEAKGREYEIRYNSEKEYDTMEDVNYRYMVFDDAETTVDFDIPFVIPIQFAGGKSKYNITKVEVYLYGEDGIRQEAPLSNTVNIVDFDEITHEVTMQPKVDEDGHQVVDEKGEIVMEKVFHTVDRISGDAEHGYSFIVPRKNEGAENGSSKVQIIFYGDVSSEVGGDKSTIIEDKTDNQNYEAGEFPFLRFNLNYCAWVKDLNHKVTGFYYTPQINFTVQNDLTITTT